MDDLIAAREYTDHQQHYRVELLPCDGGVRLVVYRNRYLDYTARFPSADAALHFAYNYEAKRQQAKRLLDNEGY